MVDLKELQKALKERPKLDRIPASLDEALRFLTREMEWFEKFDKIFNETFSQKFRCSEFGNANSSDACLQCPSNSECATQTCLKAKGSVEGQK